MPEHSTLHEALLALQAELPTITKDNTAEVPTKSGGKYTYKYADLGAVHDALFPLLNKHGLIWVTAPTVNRYGFTLHYQLLHSSGGISGKYYLPQGTPQEIGSAITYARRYALLAVCGVAPEDDDGAAATAPRKPASVDPYALAALVDEWVSALNDASSLAALQAAWEGAGRAGVTSDPRVVAAKDARKKALS